MRARTQALAVDFFLAVGAMALGVLGGGLRFSLVAPAFVLVGLVVFVATLYLAEQAALFSLIETYSPISFAVVVLAGAVVGAVLVGGQAHPVDPIAALLLGSGIGLFGYRLVYGILNPLPERRLQQARLLGGEDWTGFEKP